VKGIGEEEIRKLKKWKKWEKNREILFIGFKKFLNKD
jgi:hypothetical protein